jgi:tetratricopeptide (TPR) repeat protein
MSERALDDAKIQLREMLKEAKYPQARIFATQVLKNYGNDAELLYLRGTACAHRSATQQAEKDLRAAISLRPTCIDYYLTLCNLLFSTGKYEPAFSEYMRARNMAPHHPKIKAFTEIMNGQNGKLNRELSKIESEYNATHYKVKIADQLVSLCLIKALFGWHVRHQGKSLLFFATNTAQIEDAAYYLDRIRLLPFLTNTGRQKRAKLENLIAVSGQRRFDGFISDRILSLLIVVIGISVGGFVDLIYALSAIASFYAFMRPNYIFNRGRQKHGEDWAGRFRLLLDFAYGENIKPSNNIFSGIGNYHHRQVVAGILRSLLRGTLMPVSAYAGFYKNFNTKYAVVFAISICLVAFVFAR